MRTLGTPNGPVTLSALQAGVNAAASHGGGWLPIAFNAVCDSSDPGYSTCMAGAKPVDAAVLSAFLDWMASGAPAGSSVQTVRQAMGLPAPPPLPFRPTAVSLTFDDGDASQYGTGSLLAAHHQRGTFYINSGAIDAHEAGAMTWAQVGSLAADGNDIGGHTRTHVNMAIDQHHLRLEVARGLRRPRSAVRPGLQPGELRLPRGSLQLRRRGHRQGLRLPVRPHRRRAVGRGPALRRVVHARPTPSRSRHWVRRTTAPSRCR